MNPRQMGYQWLSIPSMGSIRPSVDAPMERPGPVPVDQWVRRQFERCLAHCPAAGHNQSGLSAVSASVGYR